MSEKAADELVDTPRERGARYIVEQGGQPVAVLLALDEYTHYLELQDDEADSLDPELAARLVQAASPSTDPSRLPFREYLSQRQGSGSELPG